MTSMTTSASIPDIKCLEDQLGYYDKLHNSIQTHLSIDISSSKMYPDISGPSGIVIGTAEVQMNHDVFLYIRVQLFNKKVLDPWYCIKSSNDVFNIALQNLKHLPDSLKRMVYLQMKTLERYIDNDSRVEFHKNKPGKKQQLIIDAISEFRLIADIVKTKINLPKYMAITLRMLGKKKLNNDVLTLVSDFVYGDEYMLRKDIFAQLFY